MTDLYLNVAHSSIGQRIFSALNLPKPMLLARSPEEHLHIPSGQFLLAACEKSYAINSLLATLSGQDKRIEYFNSSHSGFQTIPKPHSKQENVQEIKDLAANQYDALIFDATGVDSVESLSCLYEFFHVSLKNLKTNGKILILGQQVQQINDVQTAAAQYALIGLCKSIAKECGKNGSTCNMVTLQKGAQKFLVTSLAFFLSSKSAYVSGQSVTLGNNSIKQPTNANTRPLEGKIALVTGAAQGIGKETAIVLARDGATVICLDIPQNQNLLTELSGSIGGHSLAIDLLAPNALPEICLKLAAQVGVIDIVVHNAGITRDKTLAKMSKSMWDQVLSLNFDCVVKLTQTLIEQAILNEHARIICISSISGIAGNFGQSNYACSKAGIVGYVDAFAQSIKQKSNSSITINAIAPGFIETQMTQKIPLLTREIGRRMNALSQGGLPIDIAEAVSYFCHPGSHSLNGNVLRVCGLSFLGK